jgi:hypothetical protein
MCPCHDTAAPGETLTTGAPARKVAWVSAVLAVTASVAAPFSVSAPVPRLASAEMLTTPPLTVVPFE